jgi:tellurite resistance-related uncharacterized protein
MSSRMPEKVSAYKYKTRFGSYSDMIVTKGEVESVLVDEYGEYTTPNTRLDNNLADPNRYKQSRLVGKLI